MTTFHEEDYRHGRSRRACEGESQTCEQRRNAMIMKTTFTLLTALLLSPLAAFAQAKPEVANATKAANVRLGIRAAEKKALWQQQREALTTSISPRTRNGRSSSRAVRRSRATIMRIRRRRCWRTTRRCFASGTSATADMRGRWLAAMTPGYVEAHRRRAAAELRQLQELPEHLPPH